MKKSKWLDCQGNEVFPKQKGTPSLVKIEHKNTATLDSARSKKKSKVAVLQLFPMERLPPLATGTVVPGEFACGYGSAICQRLTQLNHCSSAIATTLLRSMAMAIAQK